MLLELSQLEIAWIELVPLQERFQLKIHSFSTSNPDFLSQKKTIFEFRTDQRLGDDYEHADGTIIIRDRFE